MSSSISESSLSCLKLPFFGKIDPYTATFFSGSQLVQSLDFNVGKQFSVNSSWPVCNCVPYFKHGKLGELVDVSSHPSTFFSWKLNTGHANTT